MRLSTKVQSLTSCAREAIAGVQIDVSSLLIQEGRQSEREMCLDMST